MNELVSVIIHIYKQQDMIKTVIDSVYENVGIIAINDEINDGTKKILDDPNNNKNIKDKCKYSIKEKEKQLLEDSLNKKVHILF